ncbi:hypothetical protein GCM10009628_25560 [Paeniglutamicibacter kerguelensis]
MGDKPECRTFLGAQPAVPGQRLVEVFERDGGEHAQVLFETFEGFGAGLGLAERPDPLAQIRRLLVTHEYEHTHHMAAGTIL